MAARRTGSAASRLQQRPPAELQRVERADSIAAAQRLADRRERDQAKMAPPAGLPMRTHRRVASGRENIPPPAAASTAAERSTEPLSSMYDAIKRKTACYAIQHTNSGVTLAPAPVAAPAAALSPTHARPAAGHRQHSPLEEPRLARSTPTLGSARRDRGAAEEEEEEEVDATVHSQRDARERCDEASDDEQPGAAQVLRKSKKSRQSGASRKSSSAARGSSRTALQLDKQPAAEEKQEQHRAVVNRRHSVRRPDLSAGAMDAAVHSRLQAGRVASSRKATDAGSERSRSASPSPCISPSPAALSSPQRLFFQLPSLDKLYFPPTLASARVSAASTAALSPFSSSFHALLSAAASPTMIHYLLAPPAHVLHRVRYILHRDGSNQNHLARCLRISPATLSPMLRGVYEHLKCKHLSMMRAWAAQMDVRYVQLVVSCLLVWRMDETDWSRECRMLLADIRRWLLFDMPLDERNEADRSIARWMSGCKQAADGLVNETVMRQFEADYVRAVHDGVLDAWEPAAIVKTSELDSVQHDKDQEAARLDEDDRKTTHSLAFNIPQTATLNDGGRRRATKKAQKETTEAATEREQAEPKGTEQQQQQQQRATKADAVEAEHAFVSRYDKKRKSGAQSPQPPAEVSKRVKLEVDGGGSLTSPGPSWHHRPSSVDSSGVVGTPLSFLSSVTRLDVDNKPSTFFYFDANVDMKQVADQWNLPAVPVLSIFQSHAPNAEAEPSMASSYSSFASASISSLAAPVVGSPDMLTDRVLRSPAAARLSSGSDSSPFTPTLFLTTSSPSSSILSSLPHPSRVFLTPAAKPSPLSLLLDEQGSAATSSSKHDSSLSTLSIRSLSSILPTPANVTASSSDMSTSVNSATDIVHSQYTAADKDQLPLARQLDLTDDNDMDKQQQHYTPLPQRQQQQQHLVAQQLELSHLMLSMSAGTPPTVIYK